MDDVRWKQRFEHFQKSLALFKSALDGDEGKYSDLEKLGVVQLFELTLEMAWKTVKDYAEYNGAEINSPSPQGVMREAFAANIVDEADIWIDMIKQRNVFSHAYTARDFANAFDKFRRYIASFLSLEEFLMDRVE